jgi:hypothetical protein
MECRLRVFKQDPVDDPLTRTYRFAIVDSSKSKNYPANFVCMLPLKVDHRKGKNANVFGELFGDKSLDFAIELLYDALKNESDVEVKTEIERRLKLLDPKQANIVRCSVCKKTFQSKKFRKYNRNLCDDCLKKRHAFTY